MSEIESLRARCVRLEAENTRIKSENLRLTLDLAAANERAARKTKPLAATLPVVQPSIQDVQSDADELANAKEKSK